ncbi:MAG: ABC transporter permease subunit [Candidatus Poseidoniia archaeon]|jgi:ABC-type transport system involved in multi-copper enzyme maturation permease subunit|nr:hypothetical protein [Euryarchaeota archaeon]MDP6235979.1 ABC transporter permease subunit [Candidatus Poseidoniia archaeon]MDP7082588.1 ABC transporter permease subunit [Candidatus Poseidoniia archaeon]MDP7256038.1 ABC transporter permease subunit [Candidatus Poseidoniia archaeon]MDP7474052.1 ABC transporter permease subunit [Candidatus Poseidoniia archaeon]|tara:strand:+ start:9971 stop:11461 length:1491 start_codon:yes stop_codon:yes gene_type:complete
MTEDWQARLRHGWASLGAWQPLATALLAVLLLLLAQQTWWTANAETDPTAIWESRELSDDGEMWTFLYRETAAPQDGDTVLFRGTIEVSPHFSVMRNGTILPGEYSPMDGLVYNESLYDSTILRLDGLPILVHGNLSGEFFANEIVTVRAQMVWNTTIFVNETGKNVTLVRQGWEANPQDIQLASKVDRWFFGASIAALLLGGWASTQRFPGLRAELRSAWWLARFEAQRGLRSPRTIVLALFFTLFIVGMGWLLGDLQNDPSPLLGGVQSPDDALGQLAWFTFFVTSLAAVAVSLDAFVAERDSGTLTQLLARPLSREAIVLGKALGLWLSVGIPALGAQLLGLALMLKGGDAPTVPAVAGYLLLGQLMIFTFVLLQLCFALLARTGAEAAVYGLAVWLLMALVWPLLFLAVGYALGIDVTTAGFEQDPRYQAVVSHMGLFNPGYLYQMGVGVLTNRTLAVDFEGVSGWQVTAALALWPLLCLRLATWLFRREAR